jgi:hypothetical protein
MAIKKKVWTTTPDGGHWFQCERAYSYKFPEDLDNILSYQVDIVALYSVIPDYFLTVTKDNEFQLTFTGLEPSDTFAATVEITYSKKAVSREILRMPYSSMRTNDEYMKEARAKVIRSFPAWPYCHKHEKSEEINIKVVSGDQPMVLAYLRCPSC